MLRFFVLPLIDSLSLSFISYLSRYAMKNHATDVLRIATARRDYPFGKNGFVLLFVMLPPDTCPFSRGGHQCDTLVV